MPSTDISALDAVLRHLSADQKFAHDADAFLVSWDDHGKWITRTYDRNRPLPSTSVS